MENKYIIALTVTLSVSLLAWKTLHPKSTSPNQTAHLSIQTQTPENKTSARIPTPSLEELKAKTQAIEVPIAAQSLEEFEHEFKNYKTKEIESLIKSIDEQLQSKMLIKKANSERLSGSELTELTEGLRKQTALHKILIDRKIQNLEAQL
jgi:hypothetical protein